MLMQTVIVVNNVLFFNKMRIWTLNHLLAIPTKPLTAAQVLGQTVYILFTIFSRYVNRDGVI